MRRILLASVGVVMSIGTAQAACIPTPSCSTLGYESSTACDGGLKCPFGEYWNCTLVNKITEIETKVTEIIESNSDSDCVVGSIYYSDTTCSASLDSSKTPIGVVVYINGQGHGQVMALESVGYYEWQRSGSDVSTLTNHTSTQNASYDLNSCSNTEKIIAAGDSSTYPAAWAAKEYKTERTNAGDWCLPAAGIMTSIYNNLSAVNAGFNLAGGTQIGSSSIWSSSEHDVYCAWILSIDSSYGLKRDYCESTSYMVRPVLEF